MRLAWRRPSDEQIRTWVPWVYQKSDRTAYDYPATHDRVMDLLRYAVEYAEKQRDRNFTGKKLRTFLITAISQFDKMCMDIMKIYLMCLIIRIMR